MRSICKMVLMGLAALMSCLSVAAGASADKAETTAGTLAVGATVTGTSTDGRLSGTFYGISQMIDCAHSVISGNVTTNNEAGQPMKGDATSVSFSSCSNTANGHVCVVTSNASSANSALVTINGHGHTTVNLNAVTVTIGNGCFSGQFTACTWTQVTAGSVTGTFNNTTSSVVLAPSTANVKSDNCGLQGKWAATYNVTSGGLPIKVTTS